MVQPWVQTVSGVAFDLLAPTAEMGGANMGLCSWNVARDRFAAYLAELDAQIAGST